MRFDPNLKLSLSTFLKWVFLYLVSLIYRVLSFLWRQTYRIKKPYKSNKQVISVGNISVGGTGKTPLIDWLLSYFEKKRIDSCVLTRGYNREKAKQEIVFSQNNNSLGVKDVGDEPYLLSLKHPNATFYVGKDRVQSCQKAEEIHELMLLDDGMQHLKLDRDINIVLIDSLAGVGNGHLMPLGPLREPISSLNRADVILYTRSNMSENSNLKNLVSKKCFNKVSTFDLEFCAKSVVDSEGESFPLEFLVNKKCLLVSGIGNPSSFENEVIKLGGIVSGHIALKDHQNYDSITIEEIKKNLKQDEVILTTEKDWVKLIQSKDDLPLFFALQMEMNVPEGFELWLESRLQL